MKEFASAAMIRLIRLGLEEQAVPLPSLPEATGALVPLSGKKALLSGLLNSHGAGLIVRLADAVRRVPEEPVLRALLAADGPIDLLQRWGRLERFSHSRHRLVWQHPSETRLILTHTALEQRPAPGLGEDLVVFSLVINLLELSGAEQLTAGPGGEVWRRAGAWEVTPEVLSAPWEVNWRSIARPVRSERRGAGKLWQDVAAIVSGDAGARWSPQALADLLAISRRTLQRRLAEEGETLSSVIRNTRVDMASKLLIETGTELAEIGFICGFTDQAHFTRALKDRCGLTPARFRERFGMVTGSDTHSRSADSRSSPALR